MSHDLSLAARAAARLAVDYLRWTQLVPMIVAWAFLLFLVALLALVNFQEQGFTVVEALVVAWDRLPWLPRLDASVVAQPDGTLLLDDQGFRSTVLGLWGGAATVLFLVSQLRALVWGARPPGRFAGRLAVLAAALAAAWCALLAIYLLGSETFHGGLLQWLLLFTGGCLAVGLVSLYSLGIAHVLELASDGLRSGATVNAVGQGVGRDA